MAEISSLPIRQVSLAKQVENILSDRILTGYYPPDSQFPPETHLAQEFEVSRATIRSALDSLAARKLVIRRQGIGTFVSRLSRISDPLNHLIDFQSLIESNGFKPGYQQRRVEKVAPDPHVRQALELEDGDLVLEIHKIFTADGEPVIHALNHIPVRLFGSRPLEDLLFEPVVAQPFFEFFEEEWGLRIEYAVANVYAAIAKDCPILLEMKVEPETPVLIMDETSYTKTEQPVVHSTDYYPGDSMHFSLIRRRVSL
jgi:GntR family transcriptional regulator